ncbi:MAG TPA: EamA family transporter [Gaiellaceae bacterium]
MKLVAALGTVYLVWGSTFLAIAIADRSLPPLLMLSVRFLVAGVLLYAWCVWRGDLRAERPGRRQWSAAATVGGLLLVIDTGGVAWAEQRVASGLTALIVASVPVFMALINRVVFGVRLPLGAVAGIATGLVGVGMLVGPAGKANPIGVIVLLVASFAWAAGSIYARVAPLPGRPLLSAAMQMMCAGVLLAVGGASMGELSRVHLSAVSAASLLALGFLIVFGSLMAFTAYGWLLKNTSSSLLSTYAYVNPAVAVLLGWGFAGEHVGGKEIAAGFVILTSVMLLLLARWPRPEAEPIPESMPSYIQAKHAQTVAFRPVPRLAELRRIAA